MQQDLYFINSLISFLDYFMKVVLFTHDAKGTTILLTYYYLLVLIKIITY
jgi:hypothetical protein